MRSASFRFTQNSLRRIAMSLPVLAITVSCDPLPKPTGFPEATYASSDDGVPIRFEVDGVGLPALIFVHGWSCDRTYWQRQVEYFSKSRTVVTLDLAGHGDSGRQRQRWSMAAFGQDVAAVIHELDLEEVILVGHSMGGSVILETARSLPERVTALVAIDTFFDVETKLSYEQADQFLKPFRMDFAAATRSYVRDNFFTHETDPSLKEAIVAAMSQAPPRIALGALEELLTYDTASALGRIHVLIRCINSDKYTTHIDKARKYAPNFDAFFIPAAGHFLMMEKPDELNCVLSELVKDLVTEEDSGRKPRGT